MDNDSPSARSSPTLLASPRLPSTPPIPATPIREENDFDEETDGQWSPCQDDIVCISSSSSESSPPRPKKLITDFFNRTSAVQEKSMPSFLCQFNPLTNAQKSLPPCSVNKEPGQAQQPAMPCSSSNSAGNKEKKKRSAVYKTYTLRQKLEVLDYVKSFSESQAANHFGIPRTTISSWKGINLQPKHHPNADPKTKGKHLVKGSGRPLSYPQHVEEQIVAWVLQMRDLQLPIQRKDIIRQAKRLISPHQSNFQASAGWMDKFLLRNSLTLRKTTSIQQKLPPQLEKQLATFMGELKTIWEYHKFPLAYILNVDETPIWFDMLRGYTVAEKGAKQVRIRGTGADKRRISIVLTASATETMLKPMIIFKGKSPRCIKDVKADRNKVVVVYQQKAYMD